MTKAAATNLDYPETYRKHDQEGMLSHLHEIPQQCEKAWQMAMAFDVPRDYSQVNRVVILGMGGSAIGGDLVSSLVLTEAKLPIFINRDSYLPSFVDAETLVIAVSHSGMTEETLSCFQEALATDARKLVITTGGKLKDMAEERKVPIFSYVYTGKPRSALPFSFLAILGFMQRLGFISDKTAEVAETVPVLRKLTEGIKETVPSATNLAKQLAQKLYNRLPVVYGAGAMAPVARRWKTQLNENSKAWAFFEVFPELAHNAVVGYQFPAELARQIVLVILRSSLLTQRVQQRYQATWRLLEGCGLECRTIDGEGSSQLSQVMSLVLFGDYVSYYLAMMYRVDPSPVKAIDSLKA